MLTNVPTGALEAPVHRRNTPTTPASSSTPTATVCGTISRHGNGVRAWRVFGVTTKPSGRPRNTLATAVVQARIHNGKRAMEYSDGSGPVGAARERGHAGAGVIR